MRSLWRGFQDSLYAWATVALILAVWEGISRGLKLPAFLLPAPTRIISSMVQNAHLLWEHTWITVLEAVAGFVIAAVIGVLMAIIIVSSPLLEKALMPILISSNSVPKPALAPLFLIWFGFGLTSKIVISFLTALFPVVVNTVTGLRAVEAELLHLVTSLRARPWQVFLYIRLPRALPYVFSGLKVAAILAVIGAVVGEFVGAHRGLGYVLVLALGRLDTPLVFGGLFLFSVIGIAMHTTVGVLERLLCPWEQTRTQQVEAV